MPLRFLRFRTRVFPALTLFIVLLAGCTRTTPIRTLLDDPGRYEGQRVRISGTVTNAVGVLGYGAYRVDDGTATILVLTRSNGAPRQGAKVGVEGAFRSAYTVGSETAAVVLEGERASR